MWNGATRVPKSWGGVWNGATWVPKSSGGMRNGATRVPKSWEGVQNAAIRHFRLCRGIVEAPPSLRPLLREVRVYTNRTAEFLNEVESLYIARKREQLTIEFRRGEPSSTKGESNGR